jgi:hypothetical protein
MFIGSCGAHTCGASDLTRDRKLSQIAQTSVTSLTFDAAMRAPRARSTPFFNLFTQFRSATCDFTHNRS